MGVTQIVRIEYALDGRDGEGVRINTDFNDNAGGVHTSDREVNIKIPLNRLMQEDKLDRKQRDPMLATMTEEIADAVLLDNYVQSLAISLFERDAVNHIGEHDDVMRTLERNNPLNRPVKYQNGRTSGTAKEGQNETEP